MNVAELRAERETINRQIEALRLKASDLSAMIRQAEGPLPDRSGRPHRTGYSIKKAAQD